MAALETRRGEITGITGKFLTKIYLRFDLNKVAKEYLKMLVNNSRSKNKIANQLILLLRNSER